VLNMELGFFYVVIDPSCEFAAYAARDTSQDSLGTAYAGQLTAEQAQELDSFLSLEAWSSLEAQYGWGGTVADAPDNHYAWGDRKVALEGTSDPAPPADFPHDLRSLTGRLFIRLKSIGSPVCGPIRYTLGEVSTSTLAASDSHERKPSGWPLMTPPAALATPDGVGFEEQIVHVAQDEDAARLRNLRARYLAGEFGSTTSDAIPIVEPDGTVFKLYARDVVEFEREGEAFIPWTVLARP